MPATRVSDGRTIAEVLSMESRYGDRGLFAGGAVQGYVWCDDPNCADWGAGAVEAFWNHLHKV